MKGLLKEIREFIEAPPKSRFGRRQHFSNDDLAAYLRVTERVLQGEVKPSIDIASIEVTESQQRKGVFSLFLKHIESCADATGRTVYIESILNPDLSAHLKRRGYEFTGDSLAPNAFRHPKPEKKIEFEP